MPRLTVWIGLLVALASATQALGQQRIVQYAPPEEIPLATLPLNLAVTGWRAPGFTQASRQLGTIEGESTPTAARYEARFGHGAYFGWLTLAVMDHEVHWVPPTPQAALRDFPYFNRKVATFGTSGSLMHGRMPIDYLLLRVNDHEPKSCVVFSGTLDRAQLRGVLCAVQADPLVELAPRFIRAVGVRGLLEPAITTLPTIRATNAPSGQDIVAGAPFDPYTMPFVADAAREKLEVYVKAPSPKALAVHNTGAVAYDAGAASEDEAIRRALERCALEAGSPCMLYAVGDRVVFHHDALIRDPVVNRPSAGGGAATPLSNAQLVTYLETATALVAAIQTHGHASVRSGFFVSPDRLLTNRHVVDHAQRVLVTSRKLGHPYEARIVAITDRGAIGGADYALLEVPGIAHAPLGFTIEIAKLQEVIAAGYPGVTISNDADFSAFAQGRANAAPDLVITRGEVNALQVNQAKVATIAHTALISEGNSGGPLVDRCGRVVGINSYIAQKTTVTGFAIASRDLIEFLNRNGVNTAVNNAPCPGGAAVER
jgi:S1-C subfamily serine protease